MLVILL